jgi:hypothetical protein
MVFDAQPDSGLMDRIVGTQVHFRDVSAVARQSPGGETISTPRGVDVTGRGDWVLTVEDETFVLGEASFRKIFEPAHRPDSE